MKKKIIASILVVVMLVLSLASCGTFDFADEDLNSYVEFSAEDYATFKAALATLEIADGDFTTDEAVRAKKVVEDIYGKLITLVETEMKSDEELKLTEGSLTARDVLYFCYYVTDEAGNIFNSTDMKESAITASSTKADHVIKLPLVNEDSDEFDTSLKAIIDEFINGAEAGLIDDYIYKMDATSGKTVDNGKTVVITYKCTYDAPDGTSTKEVIKVANYEKLTLTAGAGTGEGEDKIIRDLLIGKLIEADTTKKVGVTATFKVGEETKSNFTATNEGVQYDFENVKVQWIVDDEGQEIAAIDEVTYTSEKKLEPDGLHTYGNKVDLKDKTLTYHIFPVYFAAVPEINATTIIKELIGTSITTDSLDVFEDEDYKSGEKTIKTLVEELEKLQDNDKTTLEGVTVTVGETEKNLYNLKQDYDNKKKVVTDAGSAATEAQKTARDEAEKKFNDAKDAEVDKRIAAILAVAKTEPAAIEGVIVEQYKKQVYHTLKEDYDEHIIDEVAKAIWELIDKSVKVVNYPEKLVEEFYDHLYEAYEYDFHTGDYSTNQSNYARYEGSFEKYLLKETGATEKYDGNIEAAITAEAKENIAPIIKVFVIAKALKADGADTKFLSNLEKDIEQGAYNSFYQDDDTLSEAENTKAKDDADKKAKENQDSARESAKYFIVNDDFMKYYKKQVGGTAYRQMLEDYGEINLRTAFQFNRLMAYLTSVDVKVSEDGDHVEAVYKDEKLAFREVNYTIKSDDDGSDGE